MEWLAGVDCVVRPFVCGPNLASGVVVVVEEMAVVMLLIMARESYDGPEQTSYQEGFSYGSHDQLVRKAGWVVSTGLSVRGVVVSVLLKLHSSQASMERLGV